MTFGLKDSTVQSVRPVGLDEGFGLFAVPLYMENRRVQMYDHPDAAEPLSKPPKPSIAVPRNHKLFKSSNQSCLLKTISGLIAIAKIGRSLCSYSVLISQYQAIRYYVDEI